MMGSIEIPKIDVNLPIYQGTEEQQLQSGCGWWPGTSLPTGGSGDPLRHHGSHRTDESKALYGP